jgi:hypothetical protein
MGRPRGLARAFIGIDRKAAVAVWAAADLMNSRLETDDMFSLLSSGAKARRF